MVANQRTDTRYCGHGMRYLLRTWYQIYVLVGGTKKTQEHIEKLRGYVKYPINVDKTIRENTTQYFEHHRTKSDCTVQYVLTTRQVSNKTARQENATKHTSM